MVQEIAAAGELSCGQLTEKFTLSQPTISHHLKLLVDAELIVVRNDAQHHFLSVNQPLLDEVASLLPGRLTRRERRPPARARNALGSGRR